MHIFEGESGTQLHFTAKDPVRVFLHDHQGASNLWTLTFDWFDGRIPTVDGSEIPFPTTERMYETRFFNGINYQPQLVIAGFLNHQQY